MEQLRTHCTLIVLLAGEILFWKSFKCPYFTTWDFNPEESIKLDID